MDLGTATFDELTEALGRRAVSSVELVAAYQSRIDALDVRGPGLRAVRCLDPTAAEQAAEADCARREGREGPLLGIPVLVKDNIDVAGLATTAGSLALAGWVRLVDAVAVQQLRRAGAVVLGKTNMTEWANFMAHAMPAGFSAVGGQVRNPYDPDGSPSGSSSGSAVAVAAGLAPLALGTETIGSILSPANACSAVGVKPTAGPVDRRGVVPLATSYDMVGAFAASVIGAAALAAVLRGEHRVPQLDRGALQHARLGVADTPVPEEAAALWAQACDAIAECGATLVPVKISTRFAPNQVLVYEFRRDVDAYLAGLAPQAPVHSLADVVAFNDAHAEEELTHGQSQLLQCLAFDIEDSRTCGRYGAALRCDRTLARQRIDAVLANEQLHAVVFPAEGSCGIGARAGYPSVSVPAGYVHGGRRPFGVSILGPAGSDDRLLALAYGMEDALNARRSPASLGRTWPS